MSTRNTLGKNTVLAYDENSISLELKNIHKLVCIARHEYIPKNQWLVALSRILPIKVSRKGNKDFTSYKTANEWLENIVIRAEIYHLGRTVSFPRKIKNVRTTIEASARAEVKQLGYPITRKDDNQIKEGFCEYHGEFELYRSSDKVIIYHRSIDLTIIGTRDATTTPLSDSNQRSKTAYITELTRRKKRMLQQIADIDKQILDLVQSL